MASWSVELTKKADKDLQLIDQSTRNDIVKAIRLLAGDPPQGDFHKITSQKGKWRLKLGNWRVIYERDKDDRVYIILRVVRRTTQTY